MNRRQRQDEAVQKIGAAFNALYPHHRHVVSQVSAMACARVHGAAPGGGEWTDVYIRDANTGRHLHTDQVSTGEPLRPQIEMLQDRYGAGGVCVAITND